MGARPRSAADRCAAGNAPSALHRLGPNARSTRAPVARIPVYSRPRHGCRPHRGGMSLML